MLAEDPEGVINLGRGRTGIGSQEKMERLETWEELLTNEVSSWSGWGRKALTGKYAVSGGTLHQKPVRP